MTREALFAVTASLDRQAIKALSPPRYISNTRWSPDESAVYYTENTANSNVKSDHIVHSDGSGDVELGSWGSLDSIWSADGQKIVFLSHGRIGFFNLTGSSIAVTYLTNAGNVRELFDW